MEWLLHRASIPFFMLSVKNRCISLIICCTDRIPSGIASLARIISGCNQFLPATGECRLVFRRHLRDTRTGWTVKLLCIRVEHVFSCHVRCAARGSVSSGCLRRAVCGICRHGCSRGVCAACRRICYPSSCRPGCSRGVRSTCCDLIPVPVILRRVHAPAKGGSPADPSGRALPRTPSPGLVPCASDGRKSSPRQH